MVRWTILGVEWGPCRPSARPEDPPTLVPTGGRKGVPPTRVDVTLGGGAVTRFDGFRKEICVGTNPTANKEFRVSSLPSRGTNPCIVVSPPLVPMIKEPDPGHGIRKLSKVESPNETPILRSTYVSWTVNDSCFF